MAEIGKTAVGQERLRRREEVVDRAMAEHIERHDAGQSSRPASGAGMSAPRSLVGTDEAAVPKHPEADHSMDGAEHDVIDDPSSTVHPVPTTPNDAMSPEYTATSLAASDNSADVMPNDLGSGGGLQGGAQMDMAYIQEDEPLMILAQLMPGGRSYAREKRQAFSRIISEVYSPPRLTKMLSRLPNHELVPGMALDLTVVDALDGKPLDFDHKNKRERARELLRRQKPLFLVGTPMCTAFST